MSCRKLYIIETGYRTDVLAILYLKEWTEYGWVKGKTIPATGRGNPQGCETSRLPHFLDNRLTDGGEFVSHICQLPFTPRKITGTHFC
jgi:hypothetical protein